LDTAYDESAPAGHPRAAAASPASRSLANAATTATTLTSLRIVDLTKRYITLARSIDQQCRLDLQ
jgi:hypothetical protein